MGVTQSHNRKMNRLYPMGLKFRMYESDLAKRRQNLMEPNEKAYKMERHIIGVSEHPDEISFQIIFNDKIRTKADDSALEASKWVDHWIPNKSVINRAEIMYDKNDMLLLGIKFFDK